MSEREERIATTGGNARSYPKELLVISFSDMKRDPRVYRQVNHLRRSHKVTTIGFGSPEIEGVEFHSIREREKTLLRNLRRALYLKMHMYGNYYDETFNAKEIVHEMRGSRFDLVIANDNDSLPLAFEVGQGARVLHDAHEFAPRQQEDSILWRLFMQPYRKWVCANYLPKCDRVITVSKDLADAYDKDFGVKAEVMTNAPDYLELEPSKVDDNRVCLIHHGYAIPSRGIEALVEVMGHVDARFTLDLMLVPKDPRYFEKIRDLVGKKKNVRIVDSVPMKDIVNRTNVYDIGVYLAEPVSFNILHMLPNKFFEFIQARLAVAIGPSPEMARYVHEYDCGIVSMDFRPESMAEELNKLTKERIEYFKLQSHRAARDLSSEANLRVLDKIVDGLLAIQ
jgi:hypothetical protein